MANATLHDVGPYAGHSPEQERPLGSYTALIATFSAAVTGFGAWLHVTERDLPRSVEAGDLLLITVATHKVARVLSRDRVTSALRAPFTRFQGDAGPAEVDEAARGTGMRRVIGELLICPYCLGMWIAGAFTAGLIAAPRPTRWIATTFTALTGADALQLLYSRALRG